LIEKINANKIPKVMPTMLGRDPILKINARSITATGMNRNLYQPSAAGEKYTIAGKTSTVKLAS